MSPSTESMMRSRQSVMLDESGLPMLTGGWAIVAHDVEDVIKEVSE